MGISRNQLLPALRLPSWVRFWQAQPTPQAWFVVGFIRGVLYVTSLFAAGWYLAEILK